MKIAAILLSGALALAPAAAFAQGAGTGGSGSTGSGASSGSSTSGTGTSGTGSSTGTSNGANTESQQRGGNAPQGANPAPVRPMGTENKNAVPTDQQTPATGSGTTTMPNSSGKTN